MPGDYGFATTVRDTTLCASRRLSGRSTALAATRSPDCRINTTETWATCGDEPLGRRNYYVVLTVIVAVHLHLPL